MYTQLLNKVKCALDKQRLNYSRVVTTKNCYQFQLTLIHTGEVVCELTSYLTLGNVATGITRSHIQNLEEEPVIQITLLLTNPKYRGKGLATLLVYYAICYIKINETKWFDYVILDDDTDKSTDIACNLYHKIGFVPRDLVSLKNGTNTKLSIYGPEKQLLLNDAFLEKANRNLLRKRKHIKDN